MASNLERVGVLLVAEGISGFLGAVTDAGKAVVGFLGDSINIAGDFEQTMNKLGAVSGATADEIAQIGAKAKALGADLTLPATSAVDAGNAMLELSKAGFTVQQTMDAAKGTLQLAAAANIEEAKAAEIAANAINAFGLAASDATFVADLLAATANSSSVEITDVADSYKMAGAVFSNFQAPVVGAKQAMIDLTTAVGLLGNAGIKGSDAGTSLKQALLQLTGPSKKAKGLMIELARSIGETGDIAYDAQGNMRSFPEILGLVSRATKDLTDEKRNQYITDIFGADASRAILILMRQGPDAWAAMEAAVTREGAATALATAQTKGFKGALEGAKSQIETLQLTLGEKFLPILATLLSQYISPGIAQITAFTEALFGSDLAFEQLSPTLQRLLGYLDAVRAAWNLWEKGVISTRTALDVLIPGLGDRFGPAADRAIELVGFLANNFQTIFSLITGGQPTVESLIGFITSLGNVFGLTNASATDIVRTLASVGDVVQTVISSFQSGGVASQLLGTYVDTLRERWNVLLPAITTVVNGILGVVLGVFGAVQTFMAAHGTEVLGFVTTTWNSINTIINDVLQIVAIVTGGKLAEIANYFTTYGAEIQTVATVAWNIVSGVITTALNLIQGIVRSTLLLLQGDWQGAWLQIQIMSANFVGTILNGIMDFLETIAGAFGTSLQGIRDLWSHNWDEMVKLVMRVPSLVAGVGSAIVDTISNGFSSAWNNFMASASAKLQEFRDMLPFSEPKDHSSPLFGLGKSGHAIVDAIQTGINLAPALTIPPPALPDLNEIISDAKKGDKKSDAKKPPDLGTLIPDTKKILAPITELVDVALPEHVLKSLESIRHNMALLDPSDVQGLNEMATLLEQATAAGRQEALDRARVSPPATAAQLAAGSGTVNNTRNQTINMPIHTNMTPTAISQSMAIIAASIP